MKRKNILFIISVVFSIMLGILNTYLILIQISTIKDLNYPLTSVIPLSIFLLGIFIAILLPIIAKKYKNDNKFKKLIVILLITLALEPILYFVSSPINELIQTNNIGYKYQEMQRYYLKGISYNIPKKWYVRNKKSNDNNNEYQFYYPFKNEEKAWLYVYSEYNNELNFLSDVDDLNYFYQSLIKSLQEDESTEYFKIIDEENTTMMNRPGYHVKYKSILKGVYITEDVYILFDNESNTTYFFMLCINEDTQDNLSNEYKQIINSIRER